MKYKKPIIEIIEINYANSTVITTSVTPEEYDPNKDPSVSWG